VRRFQLRPGLLVPAEIVQRTAVVIVSRGGIRGQFHSTGKLSQSRLQLKPVSHSDAQVEFRFRRLRIQFDDAPEGSQCLRSGKLRLNHSERRQRTQILWLKFKRPGKCSLRFGKSTLFGENQP
jgi:hypothetical protein